MKDYNQMAQDVFRRRDEYLAMKEKKKAMLLKAGVPLCSLVLVALLGLTLWLHKMPEIPVAPVAPTTKQTENTNDTVIASSQTVIGENPTDPGMNALPQDPTEPENTYVPPVQTTPADKPGSDSGNKYPESSTGTEDNVVPPFPDWTVPDETYPLVDPTEPCMPLPTDSWEESTYPEKPLETRPPLPQDRPSVETTLPEEPTPTEPTEAPTGPVEITVGGKKYTAQTGDMVTYTAELYVKDLFETLQMGVLYGSELEVVEVVNTKEDDPAPVHFPNLKSGSVNMNYHRDSSRDAEKQIHMTGIRYSGYNFREQKVLATFDFIVKKPGETMIALDIEEMAVKGGETYYFSSGKQMIFENINIEESLKITPAEDIVVPKPSEPEQEESVPPFVYPEESFDGEALITCDGRTYSADVGQRVTCCVELEASEKFDSVQLIVKHSPELEAYEPKETEEVVKEDVACPNLNGSVIVNFNGRTEVNGEVVSAVKMNAVNIRKYNFRKRKLLIQVDFIVASPGEFSVDLIMEVLGIDGDKCYFEKGEQLIFDGIEIYEYVIVN